MKLDKIKVYTIEFVLLLILALTLFVSKMNSKIILACLLTAMTIITSILLKKRNVGSVYAKNVNIVLIIFAVIYLMGFYIMGIYFGFARQVITFSVNTLVKYIIPITITIIASEMLRSILLAQNVKLTKVFTFIIMVIIDLLIYTNLYSVDKYDEIIELVGFTFFASVACNLLYNYVATKYGFMGNIIYRLITILYAYIIPIVPNVFVFFRSILRMIYPYVVYRVIDYTFKKDERVVAYESKRKSVFGNIILGFIIAAVAMIISCQFKYGLLIIGSGSMTGTINKGDGVFFEKYDGSKKLEVGDIIIFNQDSIQVVHRIIEIKHVNGQTRYITKGDANQKTDAGYRIESDIYATTKFRIPYIGFPTIWLRDILS